MSLEFKRGTIISVDYKYTDVGSTNSETGKFELTSMPAQKILLVDTEGKEYNLSWVAYTFFDLFGEGDKVSFLWDSDTELIIRIRLNPFYKGE